MANVDRPRGLSPVKHLNGNPYNGEFNIYFVPAADATYDIFVGDLLQFAAGADPTGKYPLCSQYIAAQTDVVGACVGFGDSPKIMANVSDLSLRRRVKATDKYIAVVDDPDVIFRIQEDGDTTPVAAASVGLNAEIIVGAGNTLTGASGMELDSDTVNTTATLPLRVLRLDPSEGNVLGAFADWLVLLNTNYHRNTTGI